MLRLEVLDAPIHDCWEFSDLGYSEGFAERDSEDGTGLREGVG